MARRRMISQDIISDEHFNSLSLDTQNVFIRMLTVSDDCGVVPAATYRLNVLINTPPSIAEKIQLAVDEIVASGLGYRFTWNDDDFFAFKPKSFNEYQSYILKKATKSEYLRIPKEEFEEVSRKFQELPRNSGRISKSALAQYKAESRKQKVESRKQKAESRKSTFGEFQNVALSEQETEKLIERLVSQSRVDRAIEILSNYKESNGKSYKSDYATFGTWVIGELEKRESNGTDRQGGRGIIAKNQRPELTEADFHAAVGSVQGPSDKG